MSATFELPIGTTWFDFVAPDMESGVEGVSYPTIYPLIRNTADVNHIVKLRREVERTKKIYRESPVTDEAYQSWNVASSRLFYAERDLAGPGYAKESEASAGNFNLWRKSNRVS